VDVENANEIDAAPFSGVPERSREPDYQVITGGFGGQAAKIKNSVSF
jgi:hypothetical protein